MQGKQKMNAKTCAMNTNNSWGDRSTERGKILKQMELQIHRKASLCWKQSVMLV